MNGGCGLRPGLLRTLKECELPRPGVKGARGKEKFAQGKISIFYLFSLKTPPSLLEQNSNSPPRPSRPSWSGPYQSSRGSHSTALPLAASAAATLALSLLLSFTVFLPAPEPWTSCSLCLECPSKASAFTSLSSPSQPLHFLSPHIVLIYLESAYHNLVVLFVASLHSNTMKAPCGETLYLQLCPQELHLTTKRNSYF